jgi:hypothetical protein
LQLKFVDDFTPDDCSIYSEVEKLRANVPARICGKHREISQFPDCKDVR